MAMTSCCGCLNLRQGTLTSAIYTIILGLLGVTGCALYVSIFLKQGGEELKQGNTYSDNAIDSAVDIMKIAYYVAMGLYVAWVLSAFFLLLAVRQRNRYMMLPWLIMTGIIIGFSIYGIFSNITHLAQVFQEPTTAVAFILSIILVVANLYASVCVSTYYRFNMKEAHEVGTNGLSVNSGDSTVTIRLPAATGDFGYKRVSEA